MDKQYETYVAGGFCGKAQKPLDLEGFIEMMLYNPTTTPCQATMTAYFEKGEPHTFAPVEVPPEGNHLLVMPSFAPDVFEDCGFWGARFQSNTPLVADLISGVGHYHPDDSFKGGCVMSLGNALNNEWHFADGLWLEWNRFYKGDLSKAPFPFNEIEYYYFLNPGDRPAKADMTLRFRNIEHVTFHLQVPAQRVLTWCNFEKIPYVQPYAAKVMSDEPVFTTSTRYIYGLTGFEEWGVYTHCAMPAKPGPYTSW